MTRTVVEVFKKRGKWHWRLRDAGNLRPFNASIRGYGRRGDCLYNLRRVCHAGYHFLENMIGMDDDFYLQPNKPDGSLRRIVGDE